MIQLYADDALIYDSRAQTTALAGLTLQEGLNTSGLATITMQPGHPAYDSFVSFKTIVTIYRDGVLLFRGRALYPQDDFLRRRVITCEGERGFLNDSIIVRQTNYSTAQGMLRDIVATHNRQVEPAKQFAAGTSDMGDPIFMEVEKDEQLSDYLTRMVSNYGGYITFTTNTEGQRAINWLKTLGYSNNQAIEFGENMLDYARSDSATGIVTVLYAYAADENGAQISLYDATGENYIEDEEAVARYGRITKVVYWDGPMTPNELLARAQAYLHEHKSPITTLELTAIDLSTLNKNIDSFRVGDLIRVISKPHGVDAYYQLTSRKYDLLRPESDRVTLGGTSASLTGSTASGARATAQGLQKIERAVAANTNTDTAAVIEEVRAQMTSLIEQTSNAIRTEVAEQYATQGELTNAISTTMTQLSDSFNFLFTELQTKVDSNDAEARTQLAVIERYIRFEDGNIILGETGNELTLNIQNDRISFLESGVEVAYFSDRKLYINDGEFLHSLALGNYAFMPRANGNLSFKKVK